MKLWQWPYLTPPAPEKVAHTRREFVYLDETSVVSLVASRDGEITSEVRDALTSASGSEVNASLGVPTQLGGGTVGSRLHESRSESKETVRRAVIQSTFKDLLEGEQLAVCKADPTERLAKVQTIADLTARAEDLGRANLLLSGSSLLRGDAIELQVELRAEDIYQLAAAVSSLTDLVRDRFAMFSIDAADFQQVSSMVELIEGMLAGLVPVRGTAVDFKLISIDSADYLIANSLIAPDSEISELCRPLVLVGITEESSYWQDVRRVLFGAATYTMFARIARPGIVASWVPIKLLEVLEKFAPDLISSFDALGALGGNLSSAALTGAQADSGKRDEDWLGLLEEFILRLAVAMEVAVDANEIESVCEPYASGPPPLDDLDAFRQPFDSLVEWLESRSGDGVADRDVVLRLRDTARQGYEAATAARSEPPPAARPDGNDLIECEIIAIYW